MHTCAENGSTGVERRPVAGNALATLLTTLQIAVAAGAFAVKSAAVVQHSFYQSNEGLDVER